MSYLPASPALSLVFVLPLRIIEIILDVDVVHWNDHELAAMTTRLHEGSSKSRQVNFVLAHSLPQLELLKEPDGRFPSPLYKCSSCSSLITRKKKVNLSLQEKALQRLEQIAGSRSRSRSLLINSFQCSWRNQNQRSTRYRPLLSGT